MDNTNSSSYPFTNVTEIHDHDVLCGRGAGITKHPGNIRWRGLIQSSQAQYISLPRNQRPIISESIVLAVRSLQPPGRFLAKDPFSEFYHDIGDEKATEKTAQAMRDSKKNSNLSPPRQTPVVTAMPTIPTMVSSSLSWNEQAQSTPMPPIAEPLTILEDIPMATNTAPQPLRREESSSGLLRMSIGSVSMDWGLQSGHSRCSFGSRRSTVEPLDDRPSKTPARTESGFSMASLETLPDDQFDRLEASCSKRSSRMIPRRIDSCASRVSCFSIQEMDFSE